MPCPCSTASWRGSPRAGQRPTAVLSPGPGDSHGYPRRPGLRPAQIIGVGLNYANHAAQVGRPAPRRGQIFLKAPSAVIGNGQAIVLPAESSRVEHESALAVVIGQTMRLVTARGALEGIAGVLPRQRCDRPGRPTLGLRCQPS
ncbi:fumarylacetoacetate hydrolase family protein [Streptomyces sp. NPDC005426]|uniref:fumarylacetoacetate hydrolase family protein n=1 Tax=Streptomyces sp. NPDC005426 TaxID=3155344 RepID=UPI0033B18072